MNYPIPSLATSVVIATIALGSTRLDRIRMSGAPINQSKTTVRAGWVTISNSGFTIALPSDMKVKDLSQEVAKESINDARPKDASGEKAVNTLKTLSANGQLKLIATLKHGSTTGYRNALAIVVTPNAGSKTDDELLAANLRTLEKTAEPGTLIGKKIMLPCGHAIRIQSNRPHPGAPTTAATSYLVVHDNRLFVFSFVSRLADKDDWRVTAQLAMESLTFDH